MPRIFIATLMSLLFALEAHSNQLLLDVSNQSFNIRGDATHASDGIIYSGSLLLTDDDEQLVSLGLWTNGQVAQTENLFGGLGAKVYAANSEDETFFALSIGGHIEYLFSSFPDLSLISEFYYAPEVTVSDDFDYLNDFTFRINYKMFDNASVFTGLRRIALKHESDDVLKLDNRIHAGINITF